MGLFEEYKNHQDPFVRERANNWAIAIGLQRVDGLNVSDFLIHVARQEIEGKITMVVLTSEMSNLFEHLQRVQPTFAHRAMKEALTMIDEHYAQTNSNRTSYEIVPLYSEDSKRKRKKTSENETIRK